MIKKKKATKFSVVLIEENLVGIHFLSRNVFRQEDLMDIRLELKKLSFSKPIKVLVEVDENTYFDFDGEFKADSNYVMPLAEAIVPNGLSNRLLIEYYYTSKITNRNYKIFKNKSDALIWLQSI